MNDDIIDYAASAADFDERVAERIEARQSFSVENFKNHTSVVAKIRAAMSNRNIPFCEKSVSCGGLLMGLHRIEDEVDVDRYVIRYNDSTQTMLARACRSIDVIWETSANPIAESFDHFREQEKERKQKAEAEAQKRKAIIDAMTPAERLIYEMLESISGQVGELECRISDLENTIDELKE